MNICIKKNNQQIKYNNLLVSYFFFLLLHVPKIGLRVYREYPIIYSFTECVHGGFYYTFFRFIFDSHFSTSFSSTFNKRMEWKKKHTHKIIMNKPMFHTAFVVFHIHTNKSYARSTCVKRLVEVQGFFFLLDVVLIHSFPLIFVLQMYVSVFVFLSHHSHSLLFFLFLFLLLDFFFIRPTKYINSERKKIEFCTHINT